MKLDPAKPFEKKSDLMKKMNGLGEKAPLPPIPAKPNKARETGKTADNKNGTAYQVCYVCF